ncbi:MAG: DUF4350 domain-containing protein [Novosphingobium sp.]
MSVHGQADNAPAVGASPFNPRVALAMVLFGAFVFIALLWMIGAGWTQRPANNGQAHASGKGLAGYAGLAQLLGKQGYAVSTVRSQTGLQAGGLLILTPPHYAEGEKIAKIIRDRRYIGPTMLVLPKWQTMNAQMDASLKGEKVGQGWVTLTGAMSPGWTDDLKDVGIKPIVNDGDGERASWKGLSRAGALPDPRDQTASGDRLVALVANQNDSTLAGFIADNGYYPDLAAAAGTESPGEDEELYPLIVVAEPDLLNNWAMADRGRAMLALDLIDRANAGRREPVAFDLTLNGMGQQPNLLTLAFQPPFVAATICLMIAALIAGWRAFRRYGPALAEGRAIAFGKRALVANSAGLIHRAGRLHLLAAPYATLVRERLARKLALPRTLDVDATEAAIDRALAARDGSAEAFSHAAARMRAARGPADLLRAGRSLYSLERILRR